MVELIVGIKPKTERESGPHPPLPQTKKGKTFSAKDSNTEYNMET